MMKIAAIALCCSAVFGAAYAVSRALPVSQGHRGDDSQRIDALRGKTGRTRWTDARRMRPPRFHAGGERPMPPEKRLAGRATFCPILYYHYIRKYDNPNDQLGIGLSVSPTLFRNQMAMIRRRRFHTVTVSELAAHIRYGKPLPSRCLALTFDDGYEDQYANGFAILRHFHVKATFFVVSSFVDTPGHVTWKQVRRLAAAGMDIGDHTIHHVDLYGLPGPKVWREIDHSKMVIERHIHRHVHVFAYPYGGLDPAILAQVRKAGYTAAVSTLAGTLHAQASLYFLFRDDMAYSTTATIATFMATRFGDPFEETPCVVEGTTACP